MKYKIIKKVVPSKFINDLTAEHTNAINQELKDGVSITEEEKSELIKNSKNVTDAPKRTIIPRNKQRCRYISVKFEHSVVRDYVKIVGVAHNVREVSEKAYK